jgi:ATP-dependent DNA helicase DinG
VSCGPNECPGASRCDAGDECFAEHARMQADGADIIVVNHALYCAHLAAGGSLLPHHDVVVFDEAHALEATATKALGFDVSAPGLRQLAGRLRRAGVAGEDTDGLVASADALDRVLEELDGRVDPTEPRLAGVLASVAERIAALTRHVNRESGGVAAAHAAQLAGARLDAIRRLQVPAEGEVAWVDGDVRPVLRLAPIVVGPRLGPALFEQVTAVLVSATLGSGLRFEPLARRLGLDPDATSGPRAYAALRADSPFDFRRQAMLYVPRAIPDPRRDGWEEAAATELCALVAAAGGRALVLCTSRRAVDRLAACLREETDHVVLAQGDEANAQLAARFTDDETSCLVATRAFWVGLDVPGPACVLVVIDRLPFARPDDPLEQARREAAEQSGGSGFRDVDLPSAALVLAQGTGRLVRRRDDRGVVAVLDPRLATAGYRSVLLDALPPMRRVVDRATVVEFLGQAVG